MGSSYWQLIMKRSISPAATPEAALNPQYCNANTPGYAIIWDDPSMVILIHAKKLLILSMLPGVCSHLNH